MLQRCTAGSSSTSLGTPVAGGASLSLQHTESLTLSPRSPRFPGTPCGGQERGAQEGITQTRVQLRKGGYLLLAHDPPLALGVHPHPARRKGHEKGVGGTPASPQGSDSCNSGSETCQAP